jgi:predicted ribosome quality control (RQC) complex YloA/Tae2 family protein
MKAKIIIGILIIGFIGNIFDKDNNESSADKNNYSNSYSYEELQRRYNTLQESYDNLNDKYKELKRQNSDINLEKEKYKAQANLYDSQEEKIKNQKEEIKELRKIKEDYKYLEYHYRIEKENAETYWNYWMKCLDEHTIVYCNERSGIYHIKPNCSGLKSSIKMLTNEAKKDGYRSCQKCL